MSNLVKRITGKSIWVNILAAIGILVVLLILFFSSLGWLTGYGKVEKVPSVTGQNVLAAQQILQAKGFDVVIQDSLYIDNIPKQAVIRQSPEADATVKSGRAVYLTVNRSIPPQVEMPNMAGFSIRSAEMYLRSLGLKLGEVTYKPDIARNSVLEQYYNGAQITAGTKIPLGSTISFVLGSGVGGSDIPVPDLVGMTLLEARTYLATVNVNIGSIVATDAVKDSAAAFIVKQSPTVLSDVLGPTGQKVPNKIRQGQVMDIYISSIAPVRDSTAAQTPVNH